MQQNELDALFDQHAAGYDAQWARMAPIRESLHFLLEAVFADLPDDARLLCVGAGTGAEVAHLARRFPHWRFLALDPSAQMIAACRTRAEREGFADRCEFHAGVLETLPASDPFDGATCFLVSQFLLDPVVRTAFFADIAKRMRVGGTLAWADPCSNRGSSPPGSSWRRTSWNPNSRGRCWRARTGSPSPSPARR